MKSGNRAIVISNGCHHEYLYGSVVTLTHSYIEKTSAYGYTIVWRVLEGTTYIAEKDLALCYNCIKII